MSINFATKNVKFPGALKAFAEDQLTSIEKIAGHIIDADIIVNEEKILFKVEITVKTSLSTFHGKGDDRILKQALRDALTAVKTQAKKFKEKIKEEKKRAGAKPTIRASEKIIPISSKKSTRTLRAVEGNEKIVLSDNYSRKPVSVEEAIFYLRESGENGYMFINADSGRLAAIFWNKQGNVSLLEPKL